MIELPIAALASTALIAGGAGWWAGKRKRHEGVNKAALDGAGICRVMIVDGDIANSSSPLNLLFGTDKRVTSLKHVCKHLDDTSADAFTAAINAEADAEHKRKGTLKTSTHRFIEYLYAGNDESDAHYFLLRDVTNSHRKHLLQLGENDSMKEEVRRLSSSMNHTDTLQWMRNENLDITYCNLAYNEAVEEIEIGDDDVGVPELYTGLKALATHALEKKTSITERKFLVVDGTRRFFEITELYLEDIGGTKGMARDITEMDEVGRELERYKLAQADLIESSSSAIAVYSSDTHLQFFNQAYVQMWGYDEHWLDSSPDFGAVLEFLREKRRLPEQANFQSYKKNRLRIFTDLLEPEEELYFLPDGRTIRAVAIPYQMGGVLLTYEDVTDRLALERSYNTLIAVQRETLDNLHEGIAVFGEDGKLRLSNPMCLKLWELSEKDATEGEHYMEMMEKTKHLIASDWDEFIAHFKDNLLSRQLRASRVERTDGSVLDWSMVPLPDGGTLVTYIDVTDSTVVERSLREKNDALQAADRLKSEFLANVSYELRSPLTSISGFAEMLSQNYFGELNDKQREYVEGINSSANHLMHIIGDILDLASIEAGYLTLDIAEFAVKPMLESVQTLLTERMKEMHLNAKIKCAKGLKMMKGDETRLRQVLFHLLSNAVKYSPEDGTVTISAAKNEDDEILLSVRDEGEGIAEEEREAIFDKFYRGKAGSGKAGAGLGLSMVRSFIDLHGGRVLIDSSEKGTTFTCIIPSDPPLTEEERHLLQLRDALKE